MSLIKKAVEYLARHLPIKIMLFHFDISFSLLPDVAPMKKAPVSQGPPSSPVHHWLANLSS